MRYQTLSSFSECFKKKVNYKMTQLRVWGPQVSTGRGSECVEVSGAWARAGTKVPPAPPTPFSTSPPLVHPRTHATSNTRTGGDCKQFCVQPLPNNTQALLHTER